MFNGSCFRFLRRVIKKLLIPRFYRRDANSLRVLCILTGIYALQASRRTSGDVDNCVCDERMWVIGTYHIPYIIPVVEGSFAGYL